MKKIKVWIKTNWKKVCLILSFFYIIGPFLICSIILIGFSVDTPQIFTNNQLLGLLILLYILWFIPWGFDVYQEVTKGRRKS